MLVFQAGLQLLWRVVASSDRPRTILFRYDMVSWGLLNERYLLFVDTAMMTHLLGMETTFSRKCNAIEAV